MICEYKIDDYLVYKYILPVMRSNMYVIISDDNALILDPHVNIEVTELLKSQGVKKLVIILTHEHFDHILGVNYYRNMFFCNVYGNDSCKDKVVDPKKNLAAFADGMLIDRSEEECKIMKSLVDENYSCNVDKSFEGEMQISFEGLDIKLIETPGHSLGSICIMVNDQYIFTGDTVVGGNKIITNLPGGSRKRYIEETKPFLEKLDSNILVFPGHGEIGRLSQFEL